MIQHLPLESIAPSCPFTMEEILDVYGKDLWYLCLMYLKDRHLAEDAFQTIMMKIWEKRFSFRGDSSPKTWLMQIAANTCRNILRSAWFRFRKKQLPEESLFVLPSKETENQAEVRRAVLDLPAKYREVILLYYFQGIKIHEIATILNIKEPTVSTRLRRARETLAQQLKGGMEE